VTEVLEDWHRLAVEGHFEARHPWMHFHERLAPGIARLVGAAPPEVIAMNTLTVNLHLMLASFYRPQGARRALLIEQGAFPSDRHAVESQLRWRGLDPATDLIEVAPRPGEQLLRSEDLLEAIERAGARLATVLLPGVQYLSGQVLELRAIAEAGRRAGATVGFDLAHSIGNVELALHDSGADFAVWCHYKYVNGGPGAVAGAFVHERHAHERTLPRLAGWWGHEPGTRFAMGPEFVPRAGADGWQLSNPPILSMAPLVASLALFDEAGMPALRAKSLALTGYLEGLLAARVGDAITVLTPADPQARGCALSLRVERPREAARAVFDGLRRRGMLPDWREPGVIRAAPVPLYNRFEDAWRFVEALRAELGIGAAAAHRT
jgi:kynureninase